ncbi:MAG: hemin uptake protein HemP [Alphaproteobacteria bacterium]|jgi:hemin uptake protein HemP|nr:hemin uptake protein HemP [Alphaproteobacteria bacterium]
MTQITRPVQPAKVEQERPILGVSALGAPVVESVTLMSGQRELIIRHGTETYRLRVTASNKLILTK